MNGEEGMVKSHLDPQRLFVEQTCKIEQQKKTPTILSQFSVDTVH
jgi:hypothetical protein